MLHMDIGTTNAIIAARHEAVQRMVLDSRRRGPVLLTTGTLLVRLGEWLRRDVEVPARVEEAMRPRRRPQVA